MFVGHNYSCWLKLTVRVAVNQDHLSELVHTESCDFFSARYIILATKYATLYDTVDTFIQQRHSGCGSDDAGEWWQQLADEPRFQWC
jgi:hypothetical protein